MKVKEIITSTNEVELLPCVNCGGEDIKLNNCGYSSFNVTSGKCRSCGNEYQWNHGFDATDADLARAWNRENDPTLIRQKIEKELTTLKERLRKIKVQERRALKRREQDQ